MKKKGVFIVVGMVLLAAVGGVTWKCHKSWLARYYTSKLASLPEDNATATIESTAQLGTSAVPRLLVLLQQDGPGCRNAGKALALILDNFNEDKVENTDTRVFFFGEPESLSVLLAEALHTNFEQFSSGGRQSALELVEPLVTKKAQSLEVCRQLVQKGLADSSGANRELAIVLAMRSDIHLASGVVPLLRDPEPAVRRGALTAIGPASDLVPADDLLRCLHDDDSELRELATSVLRGRGLREKDITMGRLVTDSSFLKRLEILNYLGGDNQVDPQAWLERLSQDSVPAVRAAALRAGLDTEGNYDVDFTARASQMATNDPDGTVRQIAGELLSKSRSVVPQK
jgi:hypothetical protein